MKKHIVYCTMIYNGSYIVEAEDSQDACEKVKEHLASVTESVFPSDGKFGDVNFSFGEITADFADEYDD